MNTENKKEILINIFRKNLETETDMSNTFDYYYATIEVEDFEMADQIIYSLNNTIGKIKEEEYYYTVIHEVNDISYLAGYCIKPVQIKVSLTKYKDEENYNFSIDTEVMEGFSPEPSIEDEEIIYSKEKYGLKRLEVTFYLSIHDYFDLTNETIIEHVKNIVDDRLWKKFNQ